MEHRKNGRRGETLEDVLSIKPVLPWYFSWPYILSSLSMSNTSNHYAIFNFKNKNHNYYLMLE
jgi:hypothetical protein